MRITKNTLLSPTNKSISVVNNCLFAAEGPSCVGKLDLSSLNMKYDSFFSSKMTLQPKDKFMPIMYGFLGTEVTFLTVVPDYNINPQMCPPDAYIEFYYEDQPLITRTFTDILMLSGNDLHRIPQIYVYNPTDTVVELNIMVANLDINEISEILNPTYNEIDGLSFNSIISDQLYGNCGSGGTSCTGSTQFEILDPLSVSGGTGNTQLIISYAAIDMMEFDNDTIIITTSVDTPVRLKFTSSFNALQAFSRMEWVYENQQFRYLTMNYPGLDTSAPTITGVTNENTILMHQNNLCTTNPITKENLIDRIIVSVFDYDNTGLTRDGEINKHSCEVIIINNNNGAILEEIITDGSYTVTFIYQDLAGNKTNYSKNIIVDATGPEIILTSNVLTSEPNMTMSINGDTQTPGTICYNDILRFAVDSVWDAVDGAIDVTQRITSPTSKGFNVDIFSGSTQIPMQSGITCNTGITLAPNTQMADYTINFTARDSGGNTSFITGQTLHVVDERPLILFTSNVIGNVIPIDRNDISNSGKGYYDYNDFRDFALSSITSVHGTDIQPTNVEIYIPHIMSGGTNIGISGITGSSITNIIATSGLITYYDVIYSGTTTTIDTITTPETEIPLDNTGTYEIHFIVSDVDNNNISYTKNLIIM